MNDTWRGILLVLAILVIPDLAGFGMERVCMLTGQAATSVFIPEARWYERALLNWLIGAITFFVGCAGFAMVYRPRVSKPGL